MKKLYLMMILFVLIGLMAACNKTDDPTKTTTKPSNGDEVVDDFWDKDGNGIPDWQEKEITLRYATWQHTSPDVVTLDSLMIEAFTEKYPNIKVEMQIISEWDTWDESFLSLLETGDLPDVFLIQRLASFLPYNILADITEFYENDPDTQYIFESVANSGVYNGRRYAVPTFIYPNIFFVNLDVLEQAGINRPSYDWTVEQMIAIAKGARNENTHVIGMYGCDWFTGVYPKVLKGKDSGWYSWGFDGKRFNFDDPVFQTAFNALSTAINEGYCVPSLSAEELEEYYNDPAFDPRYGGKVAIWSEPSWSAKDYFDQMASFNWDAYPGPGGVSGGNIDLAGISALSEHKDAAYQLLKWMTFGEDGLLKRFELFDEELYVSGNNYGYPVVDYGIDGQGRNKVWESIPYGEVAPGLVSPAFIESLKKGSFWENKGIIGWDEVNEAVSPYFEEIMSGNNTYAALKEVIQQAADQAFQQAIEAMKERMGK